MTARPSVLDNLSADGGHADALAYLVSDLAAHDLSVATGYVNLGGLHELATIAGPDRPLRLLLGAQPDAGLGAELPALSFEHQLALLAGERDLSRFPPSRAAERLREVERFLDSPSIEVRRYTTRFLHGKAYLFGDDADPRAALVTSANLTAAGLHHNLELGLVDYNVAPSGAAIAWFDRLWGEATPFKDELRRLLFPDVDLVDAETVYLRALLELYGEELASAPAAEARAMPLASFQRDGYERARRILERHGGVVYADGVGTGKTRSASHSSRSTPCERVTTRSSSARPSSSASGRVTSLGRGCRPRSSPFRSSRATSSLRRAHAALSVGSPWGRTPTGW